MEKGQKVKCIADKFVDEPTNPFRASELNLPKKGKKYTIRDVIYTDYGTGIRLKEIKNRKYWFDDIAEEQEPIFDADRFEIVK